jgi:hypothetical protein
MSANQFQDAQNLFKAKNLELPELIALLPDNKPYQVLAIQPSGLIAVRNDFIGNADHETAKKKFAGFIFMPELSRISPVKSSTFLIMP